MAPCLNLIETGTRTGRRCRTRGSDLRSGMRDAEITTWDGRSTSYELRVTICQRLERELGCELDSARAASPQKWIADAHVAGGAERIETRTYFTISRQLEAIETCVRNERGQERISEIRMIENVEELGAKLQTHALGDGCGLVYGEVPLFECRSTQRVASEVSVMPCAWYAVRSSAVSAESRIHCARNGEGS